MRPPERVETERLILRVPMVEDAQALFTTFTQDREVTRYMTWRPHAHIGQTLEFLKGCVSAWRGEERFPYAITLKDADAPIGVVELRIDVPAVEVGYVLARVFWGKGYMPEAVRALIDWALTQKSIYRVFATCDVDNAASARVLEKVGMQREGVLRRSILHPNISAEPRDCYMYATVRYSKTAPRPAPPPPPPPAPPKT